MGDFISNLVQRGAGLVSMERSQSSASESRSDSSVAYTLVKPDIVPFDETDTSALDEIQAMQEAPTANQATVIPERVPGAVPAIKTQGSQSEAVEPVRQAQADAPRVLPAPEDTLAGELSLETETETMEIQTEAERQTRDAPDVQVRPAPEMSFAQDSLSLQIREASDQLKTVSARPAHRVSEGIPGTQTSAGVSVRPDTGTTMPPMLDSATPVEQMEEELELREEVPRPEAATIIEPATPRVTVETRPLIRPTIEELPGLPEIRESDEASSEPPSVQVKIGTIEVRASTPEPATPSRAISPRGQGFDEYTLIRNYINWK